MSVPPLIQEPVMVTNYEAAIFGNSSSQLWVGMMTERKWRHNLAWSIASAGHECMKEAECISSM